MGRTHRASLWAATAALSALTALSLGASAGAQVPPRCSTVGGIEPVPFRNIEAIIDDSFSMRAADPDRLRVAGLELFIANLDNRVKTLGVVEFGTAANTVFRPRIVSQNRDFMVSRLRSRIRGDNGNTNYDAGFFKAFEDNRGAEARIFLTDGAHDGTYLGSHRGGPRTFVVGLGIGAASSGDPKAVRLQQIATETGGVYYPGVATATIQPTFRRISSAINCLPKPRTFRSRRFTKKGQKSTRTVRLNPETKRIDLDVNWTKPTNRFSLSSVILFSSRGRVLSNLSGKGRPRKLRTRRASGQTFRSLSLRKTRGAQKIRFTITARKITKPERTVTQFTERKK